MPFADEMISAGTAEGLARAIAVAAPEAPLERLRRAPSLVAGLPLRERADLLRDALLADVPGSHADLARVVRTARDQDPEFGGWMIWPVTTAVAARAVEEGTDSAFDDALELLAELTELLSSEFAIRVLLRHDHRRALVSILRWTSSENAHVRRLTSEGTRPYLPWAVRVPELARDPSATIPILDSLYRDPSEYVRRSVANHLNDLSRDHGDLVVATARRWLTEPDVTTQAVVRHGLRTLVKRGHPDALAILGFTAPAGSLQIDGPWIDRDQVAIGEAVELRAEIRNVGDQDVRLAIDYVVHHQKANGSLSPRTFKLTNVDLAPGRSIALRRSHSFRLISTRRYHPGPHAISLRINSLATEKVAFELVPESP